MSYILDALKKAEQERGSTQMQTVTAGHAERPLYRYRWWPIAGAVAICVVAIAIILLFYPERNGQAPIPDQTSAAKQADIRPTPEPLQPVPAAIAPQENVNQRPAEISASAPKPIPIVPKIEPAPAAAREQRATSPRPDAPPSPEKAEPASVTLQEAMSKMTLTALMYSDVPSERVAFINGRKFKEGDLVEGRYRVEKIALEGVELSFQGERLLLSP
jgi:hypothetical protein